MFLHHGCNLLQSFDRSIHFPMYQIRCNIWVLILQNYVFHYFPALSPIISGSAEIKWRFKQSESVSSRFCSVSALIFGIQNKKITYVFGIAQRISTPASLTFSINIIVTTFCIILPIYIQFLVFTCSSTSLFIGCLCWTYWNDSQGINLILITNKINPYQHLHLKGIFGNYLNVSPETYLKIP